jgi:hypothetical protein
MKEEKTVEGNSPADKIFKKDIMAGESNRSTFLKMLRRKP